MCCGARCSVRADVHDIRPRLLDVRLPTVRLTLNAINATLAAVTVDDDTARADIAIDAGAETAIRYSQSKGRNSATSSSQAS